MAFENTAEQYKPQEARVPAGLGWQPTASDYRGYVGTSLQERDQANQAVIQGGILNSLQLDFLIEAAPVWQAQAGGADKSGYIKGYKVGAGSMGEKAEELQEVTRLQAVKPLADARVSTPTAQDKQAAEADRTNASNGSIAEVALKSRGMNREQIAQQLIAQGDSLSVEDGNGFKATKTSLLTEKDLVKVGGQAYDRQAVVAYNPEQTGVVSDATNAKAQPADTTQYEQDKSKIVGKPVEVQTSGVVATGLDCNTQEKPSNKLADFVQSAAARAMSPEARQAAIQGFIDKTLGIGEGLNLAKEDVKTSGQQAIQALQDGSVARFMAQPNAINEPLFKSLGACFDAMKRDPNTVNNVLTVMGRELEAANKQYSQMSDHDRGVQDGRAMFWFMNPSGSTEAGDLALKIADNVATHVDAKVMQTAAEAMKAVQELAKTSAEAAQQTKQMLLDYLNSKGLTGPQMKLAGMPDGYFDGMKPSEPLKVSDTMNAMSKADDLGGGRLVNKGVDATGKAVGFSKDSGIEITTATGELPDSIWTKGWSVRGFEGEVEMGNSGILARNFPTIDDAGFKNGVYTSMKTIDLTAPTYQNLEKLQKRLNNCLEKVIDWNGQRNPWAGIAVSPSSIKEKILNIGIPNRSMTADQAKVFEQLGKVAQQHGIKVKVTVIE